MARSSNPGGGGRVQKQPVLPDLLKPGMVTVFCGSAAGTRSAAEGMYYAGRGNKFWPILYKTGLTKWQFHPREFPKLAALRIGLTDLNKIESGRDEEISSECYNVDGLCQKIEKYCPRILAFIGKKATQAFLKERFGVRAVDYGLHPEYRLGDTEVFVLPSTSGLGSGYWDENPWLELADLHQELLLEEFPVSGGKRAADVISA